jgi:3,4-dihydroxy 2-butanone 4-phosphate synthase/GTP cyclohydrolase II
VSAEPHGDERLVILGATTQIPTAWGVFAVHGFEDLHTGATHMALSLGAVSDNAPVLVRVHSECLTGDVFGSQRCDCQAQLHKSLEIIGGEGRGVLVYLRQEGRGIGLLDKLRAYALQDTGLDTVEANRHLGLPDDKRDYGVGTQILRDLGVHRVRVLTNNPQKSRGLAEHGLDVVEQVPLLIPPTEHNERYLRAKRDKLGHLLGALGDAPGPSS